MAVDKKSDHYNSPDNYTDIDGNMRTFTYIHHGKKKNYSMGGMSKKSKGKTLEEETHHAIVLELVELEVTEDQDFIDRFDKLLKQYNVERYRKGVEITTQQLIRSEETWYDDLKKILDEYKLFKRTSQG